jgi:hypothetical protein
MSRLFRNRLLSAAGMSAIAACCLTATPALAQPAPPPSPNATVNLIRLLVKQHVISKKAADALLKEAEAEADQARTQQTASAAPAAATAAALPGGQSAPPPAPGTLRVPYVPDIVKNQIRDEVKQDIMQKMEADNWAKPQEVPSWSKRVKITGDLRFRDEADLFSKSNDDQIIDYATFNSAGPTDINPNTNPNGIPFLDTTADRYNRMSIRARLGIDATITDRVLLGMRLASGGDNGPVSTTQLLGGGFGKKDIWLDRAFVRLEPTDEISLTAGRMPNPFFHSDLVFDEDLNFDGVAAGAETKSKPDSNGFNLFANGGFFPLEYIGANYPTYCGGAVPGTISCEKSNERQKWLLGSQVGVDWKQDSFDWRASASMYDFHNIQGELSSPCLIYLPVKECSTDASRPAFMQKGNTLFLIRQNVPDPNNINGTPNPQFAGLAFKYRLINATQEISYKLNDSQSITLGLDYVRNLAYDPKEACRYATLGVGSPVTNVKPGSNGWAILCQPPDSTTGGTKAQLQSGPTAYYARLTVGSPVPRKLWDWNVSVGYKYLEPDSMPDAFTDSDFHLGGTNAKGYIVTASLGIFDNTWVQARWFSADEVFGPPLSIDVLQLDLNAGF